MAIRRWFGKSVELDALPAELKGLLEDMRRERRAFEAALVRAADVVRVAEGLGDSVAQAQKSSEQMSGRLAALDGVSERLRSLQSELDALAAGGRETREQMGETGRLVQAARSEVDALQPRLQEVIGLKGDLAGILVLTTRIREQEGRLHDAMASVEKDREQQEQIGKGVADAASRLTEVQGRLERIASGVDGLTARVEAFTQTATELRQLTTEAPNLKRELGTLRTLAEFVSQKVAALEGQRDAVERATRRADGLTELMAQVDRQYAEQQTNARFLAQLEERVHGLKQLHETLLEQAEEIRRRQGEIEAQGRAQQEAFEGAGAAVQDALSGFAFERDGLAAMHQRVRDLREVVASVEQRLPALDAATAGLTDVEATAQRLGARVATLQEEVAQLEAAAAALGPVREEISRAESQARELVHRTESVSRPAIAVLDETERRVGELNEAVDGLERRAAQVEGHRAALAEMAREIDGRQSALDRALAQLDRAVGLRAETAELAERLEHESEALRSRLTQAGDAAARAELQWAEIEERSRRLSEVGTRLATFEKRYADLGTAGEKIERSQVGFDQRREALSAVRDDLTRLFGVADATVEKVRSVAALQKEIEQRQQVVEEMAGRLRQFDRYGEQLEARGRQFAEAERHLELLDAHLTDMKTQLATVLEQRDFLEKVIETTATLTFQTMQAESVLAQLREAGGEGDAGAAGSKGSGRSAKGRRP
jgi:chromosome segregation ATPase